MISSRMMALSFSSSGLGLFWTGGGVMGTDGMGERVYHDDWGAGGICVGGEWVVVIM